MTDFWDFKEEKRKLEKIQKKELYQISTQVDSFFLDKAPLLGFEERTGQQEMAFDIVQAMLDKKHILVEAGVGIGKTFAYIVPLLYYHKRYKSPIIIATSTIALQEQLAADLKTIEDIFDYHPDILIAKGQTHFLCKDRLETYFSGKRNTQDYEYYEEINKGGHEKKDWDIDIPDRIWDEINVSTFNPNNCRQKCPHKDYCFYYRLRISLKKTDGFILCNQDLLAMNMRKRNNYNNEIFSPNFKFIVIDEAHNLESRVRTSYTTHLTYYDCKNIVEDIKSINRRLGSVLDKKIARCLTLIDEVFISLSKQISRQDEIAAKDDRDLERYYVKNNIEALAELVTILCELHDSASMDFGLEDTYKTRSEDESLEKLEVQCNFFSSLLETDQKDIFWMNSKSKDYSKPKDKKNIIISKCPKNVNELTESLLFNSNNFKVIMTSATLSSDGVDNYDYFISNVNLPVDETLICDSRVSPFNYDSHAMIYYTEDIPHPTKEREAFIEAGIKEIIKLLDITNGKAMILFTAKRDMLEVYNILRERVSYKILMQNSKSSQNDVIKEFKTDVNSVLLGTGSFWEGISIEGRALSNLIIFRLPFPVPEPIIDYKRSISKDGLMEVSVPEMIIKLKQGIGRLIRNENDFGIVSIIDPRLGNGSKVPYKQLVWDALPIKNKSNDIKKVETFYAKVANKMVDKKRAV